MSDIALEISGLIKTYGKSIKAVDGLDLTVRKGVFLGFVGPNGAGKSTTVYYIAGLIKVDAGGLRISGKDVDGDHLYKRDVGFVLEQPFYMERLTSMEYLKFVGCMYGMENDLVSARAEELVSFLEIDDRKKQIRKFSAGMKKKVSLAAALIHDPKILVLDEPFEGIDAVSSRQIKDNLLHMVEKGRTIVLTSHVLDLVEKICDEIAIIDKGKVVFQGRTEDIKSILKNNSDNEKYAGLEDLFLSLVSESDKKDRLSWL